MGRQWHCERFLIQCSKNQRRRLRPAHGHGSFGTPAGAHPVAQAACRIGTKCRPGSRYISISTSSQIQAPRLTLMHAASKPQTTASSKAPHAGMAPRYGKLLTLRPPPSWRAASARRRAPPGQAPGLRPAPCPLQEEATCEQHWVGTVKTSARRAHCTGTNAVAMPAEGMRVFDKLTSQAAQPGWLAPARDAKAGSLSRHSASLLPRPVASTSASTAAAACGLHWLLASSC